MSWRADESHKDEFRKRKCSDEIQHKMRALYVVIPDHLGIDDFFVVFVGICGPHIDDDIKREDQKRNDFEKQET